MKQIVFAVAFIAAACAATGCALEQALSLVGPDGSVNLSALGGTWTSTASIGTGQNSCTNFQWKLTGQDVGSVRGEFTAICASMPASGTITGQLDGSTIAFQIQGAGTVPGSTTGSCAVSIAGTGRIEGETIRIPFSGTTCQGPVQGEEVLRRSTPSAPPPSQPPPPTLPPTLPPPTSPGSTYHIGPGPLTTVRAERVVNATADEFARLLVSRPKESESLEAAEEILLRMIWHLKLAGYQAGRQRNPSTAVSGDKLTIFADGYWHAIDVFRSVGTPGQPTEVIFLEVFPADHVPDGGIPD